MAASRHEASAFAQPTVGNLPTDRTEVLWPFQVIGIGYAGLIKYRAKRGPEKKSYILLYSCSLTEVLYLELVPNLMTEESIRTLKQFIAKGGWLEQIYSDNGKTFVARWL